MARATQPASSRLETQAQSPTPCSQGASWHRDPCPPRTLTSAGPAGPGALPRPTSCRSASLSPCGGRSARGQPAPSFPLTEAGPGAQRTCVSRADSLPYTASHSGGHEAFAGRLRSPRAEGGTRLEQGGPARAHARHPVTLRSPSLLPEPRAPGPELAWGLPGLCGRTLPSPIRCPSQCCPLHSQTRVPAHSVTPESRLKDASRSAWSDLSTLPPEPGRRRPESKDRGSSAHLRQAQSGGSRGVNAAGSPRGPEPGQDARAPPAGPQPAPPPQWPPVTRSNHLPGLSGGKWGQPRGTA